MLCEAPRTKQRHFYVYTDSPERQNDGGDMCNVDESAQKHSRVSDAICAPLAAEFGRQYIRPRRKMVRKIIFLMR
jgi:hypothetical protein